MSADQSGSARAAALIYGGVSFLAALAFLLVTTMTGSYPLVARWGGAAWVFVLLMIVLMPIVIPRVRNRRRQSEACSIEEQIQEACPLE
ncbi:MAG TPA: hypothetical protein VJP78_07265 [Thermoleophilia bacterium]|nr:MAG: hypothetical protein A2W26_09315 [Acidobacteria bacterium RBG_16_64_8]HLA81399.1 hypothetical protein [Thermoleophilia bacterium]